MLGVPKHRREVHFADRLRCFATGGGIIESFGSLTSFVSVTAAMVMLAVGRSVVECDPYKSPKDVTTSKVERTTATPTLGIVLLVILWSSFMLWLNINPQIDIPSPVKGTTYRFTNWGFPFIYLHSCYTQTPSDAHEYRHHIWYYGNLASDVCFALAAVGFLRNGKKIRPES